MDALPYTVLLIGTFPEQRSERRRLLTHGTNQRFLFLEAESATDGLRMAQEQNTDCIVLDYAVPGADHSGFLRRLSDSARMRSSAVVVVAELGDENLAAETLKHGAYDCILREAAKAPGAIQRAVAGAIAQAKFTAELQKQHEEHNRRLGELHRTIGQMDQEIRARDEFLSITAHELRTPIAAIKLKLQTGLRVLKNGSPEQLPYDMLRGLYEGADRQITRLSGLIDSLLDLSRIDAGYFSLQLETVDLAALINDVLERLSYQLSFAKCPVTTAIEPGITGQWDRLRLEQVITNLLTNAARYASGSAITIQAKREADLARIVVRDHGPGIPKEHHQRIFDRYERGAAQANDLGLGLGLYITRQIVIAHDGTIEVESEPGKGAAFYIRLPLATSDTKLM